MITISLTTSSVPNTVDGHRAGAWVMRLFPVLLAFLLPASVHAQFHYITNNGRISITKYIGAGGEVEIPDTIDGLPVVNIDNAAFYGSGVTRVGIPDSVTRLGNYAFYSCASLTSVTIGKGVWSIGEGTFGLCIWLTNVTMSDNVIAIGSQSFLYCISLASVTISDNLTSIGNSAFSLCVSLTSLTIPNSVTTIGISAFALCENLTGIFIGSGVTSIGESAFDYCTSLASITVDPLNSAYSSLDGVLFNKSQTTLIQCPWGKAGAYAIPDSVTTIRKVAFLFCTNLTSVTIPGSVTSIGDSAFEFCTGLSNITIPNSVTQVGRSAFHGCASLTDVLIGEGVTSIGFFAFLFCTSLTSITVNPLNPVYSSLDGVLFDKTQITLLQFPGGKAGAYTIPGGVRSIANSAFQSSINLTGVTIPDSVSSGGPFAFQSCASLTSITVDPLNPVYSSLDGVLFDKTQITLLQFPGGKAGAYTIPGGVRSIANSAFQSSINLTGVIIPDSVTSVGIQAFLGCTALTDVTVGKSVLIIWQEAFYGCSSLMNLYFQGNAPWLANRIFDQSNLATVYYLPGSAGWELTFGGRPTAIWHLPYPVILAIPPAFGVLSNDFGFVISWATNLSVVVESCTNLSTAEWTPVGTNDLIEGSSYFSDPQWTNDPTRFYRLRSP